MITFQTGIDIERPIEEVFAYVSDPGGFPSWNSAVQRVRPTSPEPGRVGSRYSMERQLPGGRATNELEIVVRESPRAFAIRTTSGPTPFLYRYRFASKLDATVVDFEGHVELPAFAGFVSQFVRRVVTRGIEDNLATLKLILERGRA